MADVRMGLKHVILQRLQKSDENPMISEEKKHTDFSIERILSDCYSSNIATTANCEGILDLSTTKSVNRFQENFSENVLSRKCYISETSLDAKYQASIPSETLVKPKVLKFWEHCALNNNCNGCEIFFKNLNPFQFPIVNNGLWPGVPLPRSSEVMQKFVMKSTAVSLNSKVDDEASYKCQICDKVFGCATTLQSHERTHKSPRYECLDCGKGFSQLRNYKYHLSIHRGTKEFAAECPECGKIFNDKGYLSSHMKIHRNKKEYECPYCPKSFNQRVAFNMHVRIHTGVKPHKCTECGKRFSRKMLLKQHMRTHSGEKPYQCSVCGKSFADRSNMTLHHRLHSGIKPFACPICPKAFTKKHHLKTHLNYHTGCKPYVCPHPNCNQAFTQSSNMRTHSKKCQFRLSDHSAPLPQTILNVTKCLT